MNDIRIRISGDASALQPTLDKLAELGKVDAKNSEQFKKTAKEHGEALQKTGGEFERLEHRIRGMVEKIGALFAVERIKEWTSETVKAYERVQQQLDDLSFAITKINGQSIESFKMLVEQSEKLSASLKNLYSPRQIQAAQTQLAVFGLTSKQIKELIPSIVDMAAVTGKTLTEATDKSIAAINGQTKGLRDIGIQFKDTGSKTENLNKLMKDLTKFTGGAADSLDLAANKAKEFDNQIEMLQEGIGEKLTPVIQGLEEAALRTVTAILDLFTVSGRQFSTLTSQIIGLTDDQAKALIELGFEADGSADEIRKNAHELLNYKSALEEVLRAHQPAKATIETFEKEISKQNAATTQGAIKINMLRQAIEGLQKALKEEGEVEKIKGGDLTNKGEADYEAAAKKRKDEELKEFDEQYKRASAQLDAINKLKYSGASDIEKETHDYQERLKATGLFNRDRLSMTKDELEASEALEREYNEKIKAIEEKTAKELYELKKKQLDQENNGLKIIIDKQLADKKITQEQHDIQLDKLELGRLEKERQMIIDAGKDTIDIEQKIAEQQIKIQTDLSEQKKAQLDKALSDIQTFASQVFELYQSIGESQIKAIDYQMELTNAAIQQQTTLAAAGKANTLAFEEAHQAELQKQRLAALRAQQRAKEIETFLNLVAGFTKDDPKTGVAKAIAAMTIVKGVEASFGEEGGLLGKMKDKSMITVMGMSKSHKSGKDILLHAERGEGLLSLKEVAALGGEKGFMSLKRQLAGGNEIPVPEDRIQRYGFDVGKVVDELQSVKKAITDQKQITDVHFEHIYMFITSMHKGITTETKYVPKTVIRG